MVGYYKEKGIIVFYLESENRCYNSLSSDNYSGHGRRHS